MSRFIYLGLLLLGLNAHAQAPAATESEDAKALNLLYGDFDAPDLTAHTLLGLTANQVSKPANIKAVAASLAGAAASFPQVGRGLGVEVAPIQFFRRSAWGSQPQLAASLQEYARYRNRLSRGLTLSGAQAVDDKQARVALGIAVVLLDRTDPLLDVAYVDSVAARLRRQRAKLGLQFNSRVGERRLIFNDFSNIFPNNRGYYTGLATERTSAIARVNRLDVLLAGIGLLPSATPSQPLPSITQFGRTQDSLVTALKSKLPQETLYSASQRQAIEKEAQQLVQEVVVAYPAYFDAVQQVYTATNTVVKEAKEHFEQLRWNATIVQAGGGATWTSATQQYTTTTPENGSYFVRAALRPYLGTTMSHSPASLPVVSRFFYQHVQLVAGVRYDDYRATPATESPKVAADSLEHRWWYGGRLLVGGAYLRLSGEFAVQQLTYRPAAEAAAAKAGRSPVTTFYSSTIGAEVRLADKIWLEAAIGSTKPAGQAAHLLTLGSLKYALRNSQRFKTN